MAARSGPVFRTVDEMVLTGTMCIYASQAEAAQHIPQQWRLFFAQHPALVGSSALYGASPCTDDHKLHYLVGVALPQQHEMPAGERLTLASGEYAVLHVDDPALLRDTWSWLLADWLPTSGRTEKRAPEFERFSSISPDGTPSGPIELWVPLEPSTGTRL